MTEKLKMEQNPLSATVEKIKEICPGAVTREGKIDFEELKTALSDDVAADAIEKYEFTWVGKNTAKAEANRSIRKTLRPVIEDSKNWDTTQNLYIEGDNLDTLKLLQEPYLGKIKMIYIDPPYNTGNDFVYCDEFAVGCEEYLDKKGQCDADGNRLFVNTETNGRFHSDWCSMMYPRLKIARDLLSDDGMIFIHIDEHEEDSLNFILKEIFGEGNNVGKIIWDKRNPKGEVKGIAYQHECILVFCKNIMYVKEEDFRKKKENAEDMLKAAHSIIKKYGKVTDEARQEYKDWIKKHSAELSGGEKAYNCIDEQGRIYRPVSMAAPDKPETRSHRPLKHPTTGKPCPVPAKGWRYIDSTMDKLVLENKIVFGVDETTQPCQKYFLQDNLYESVSSLLYYGGSDDALGLPFDNPKPVYVAQKIIGTLCHYDDTILDFFSGSATTAHAVMQLNAEDGGHRKFIMVQLQEKCEEDSEAFKTGYKNICEIGKERIRRAGEKIKSENPDKDLDIGFRVLRVDSTNMKDVFYKPSDTTQKTLLDSIDNIKEDRSDMDLLFGVMVDCGLPLDMPIETRKCDGKKYYVVNGEDYLVACFEPEVSEKLVYEIANLKPTIAVFRDSSFADAKDKVNVSEIFKNITGHDDCVKVL
jgi:adenine-specific DNA-methyltransferase